MRPPHAIRDVPGRKFFHEIPIYPDQFFDPDLLLDPQRYRLQEGAEAGGRIGQVGIQYAFEFQKRLIVERDILQVRPTYSGFFQTILNCVGRERMVVF